MRRIIDCIDFYTLLGEDSRFLSFLLLFKNGGELCYHPLDTCVGDISRNQLQSFLNVVFILLPENHDFYLEDSQIQ